METRLNKFLIVRLSSIGDILLTTPLLRVLRKKYPNAQIDFVVKKQFADCIKSNPNIDTIYELDTDSKGNLKTLKSEFQQNNYDWIIDLHGNFRSIYLRSGYKKSQILTFKKHKFIRFLLVKFGVNLYGDIQPVYQRYINSTARLGLEYDNEGLDYMLDEKEKSEIRIQLSKQNFDFNKNTICIAPGASFYTKRWPSEKFAQVANQLQNEKNVQIILVGSENDKPFSKEIEGTCQRQVFNYTGGLSLMETACVVSYADIVLTNDSGIMHLANALKKQTVAIYGPTVKELGFFPLKELSTVIENLSLKCRPCTHIGSNKCPKKHFKCMKDISVDTVYQTISNLLNALS